MPFQNLLVNKPSEDMQKATIRKIIKRTLYSLLGVFMFMVIGVTIVINFFLTPDYLTPMANSALRGFVRSDCGVGKVELTFVSTFPRFTVEVDSLYIRQLRDSSENLLAANRCVVAVNPWALLAKRIVVDEVLLAGADVNLQTDGVFGPLDHFVLDTVDVADVVEDSVDMSWLREYGVVVDRVALDSTDIVINDLERDFFAVVRNINMEVGMELSSVESFFNLEFGFDNIRVRRNGERLIGRTSFFVDTKLGYNRDSLLLTFHRGDVRVNDIAFSSSGTLRADTVSRSLLVDLNSTLKTPSLSEFVRLMPGSILEGKRELTSSGDISLGVSVVGVYSDSLMPLVRARLDVVDASARFDSKKVSIESLNCSATALVDLNVPSESYVDIKNLRVNSTGILDLSLEGRVGDILGNPSVDVRMVSDIDFDRFAELFPLGDGISFGGRNKSDLKIQCRVNDILSNNYGKLYLDGESVFEALRFNVDGRGYSGDSTNTGFLLVDMQSGRMLFGDRVRENNSRTLLCDVDFSNFAFRDNSGVRFGVVDFSLKAGANFDRATHEVNGVGVQASIRDVSGGVDGQLDLVSRRSEMTLTIVPKTKESGDMRIYANVQSDSLRVDDPVGDSFVWLSNVGANVELNRRGVRDWGVVGDVGFVDFSMFSELFPLDVSVSQTSVKVDDNRIELRGADLQLGSSRVVATGEINNLFSVLFASDRRRAPVMSGNLSVSSPLLDVRELIVAMNQGSVVSAVDSDSVVVVSGDSVSMLIVPRNVDFDFDLNIDKVVLDGGATLNRIRGKASMHNGVLRLRRLSLRTLGARASCSMTYRNYRRDRANMQLELKLNRVDINRIGELMPSIDSMMPVLQSFEGIVDFGLVAKTDFSSSMDLLLPTTVGAVSIGGRDLVLMDSETFASLSKMLMFRNKKRNLIDSMSVMVMLEDLRAEVLPFRVDIDRYSAIVGGYQTIDPVSYGIDYFYNVSILRSPLPFKAGVDIFGTLDDWDFKISRAKLKNTDFSSDSVRFADFWGGVLLD